MDVTAPYGFHVGQCRQEHHLPRQGLRPSQWYRWGLCSPGTAGSEHRIPSQTPCFDATASGEDSKMLAFFSSAFFPLYYLVTQRCLVRSSASPLGHHCRTVLQLQMLCRPFGTVCLQPTGCLPSSPMFTFRWEECASCQAMQKLNILQRLHVPWQSDLRCLVFHLFPIFSTGFRYSSARSFLSSCNLALATAASRGTPRGTPRCSEALGTARSRSSIQSHASAGWKPRWNSQFLAENLSKIP